METKTKRRTIPTPADLAATWVEHFNEVRPGEIVVHKDGRRALVRLAIGAELDSGDEIFGPGDGELRIECDAPTAARLRRCGFSAAKIEVTPVRKGRRAPAERSRRRPRSKRKKA